MSIGASIGMNFINKGIDQFTFGVGKEYDRYAREKSRKWQVQNMQNAMTWRIKDGMRMGIHPLASIGAGVSPGSPISVGGSTTNPSGPGSSINWNDPLLKAQIKKTEAETKHIETMTSKLGQNPADVYTGNGTNIQGQPDGTVTLPRTITSKHSPGIESGVASQLKYELRDNGYYYKIPSDNESYSDEAPWSTQFLFLYDELIGDRRRIQKIKKNWNQNNYDKQLFLQGRPPQDPGFIALFDETRNQWKRVPKTRYNEGMVFLTKSNKYQTGVKAKTWPSKSKSFPR